MLKSWLRNQRNLDGLRLLGEAIGKHVVGSNVHGADLFCFVKEAHVVGFERYVP